jgi:hypothetical protein
MVAQEWRPRLTEIHGGRTCKDGNCCQPVCSPVSGSGSLRILAAEMARGLPEMDLICQRRAMIHGCPIYFVSTGRCEDSTGRCEDQSGPPRRAMICGCPISFLRLGIANIIQRRARAQSAVLPRESRRRARTVSPDECSMMRRPSGWFAKEQR